jgi:sugar diacid utilization regulator
VRDSIFAAESVTGQRAQAVLGEISWQLEDTFFLTVFQIADEFSFTQSSLYICRHLETDVLHSCAITYASQIIWLINTRDIAETKIRRDYERVVTFIVREFNCRAGLSKPFGNFLDTHNAYVQGTAALRLGHRRDSLNPVYRFADLIVDYILERMTSELPAKDLLHPGAVTLWTLDRNDGTGYVKTLRSYIDFQFNMTQAAEKLGLHRTTLIRRLEKIGEITGIDFHRPKEMLQLILSLYMIEDLSGAGPLSR